MKISKLIDQVSQEPSVEVPKGTSRFCYRDRTLWYKDGKLLYPVFSHRHSFIVSWPEPPIAWKTRTDRDFGDLKVIKSNWKTGISEGGRKPCVEILHNISFNTTGQYLVSPLLADIGAANARWADEKGAPTEWTGLLEDFIRSLAYQTIKKENITKELIALIGQVHDSVSVASKEFDKEAAPIVAQHCAPPDYHDDIPDECYGIVHNGNHLWPLVEKAKQLDSKAQYLRTLIESFKEISKASTARHLELEPDSKRVKYKDSLGLDGKSTGDDYPRRFNTGASGAWLRTRGLVTLRDWSSQAYSYYWVREHIQHYLDCLRAVGIPSRMPFGLQPEEWDYTVLSAPLFASKGH